MAGDPEREKMDELTARIREEGMRSDAKLGIGPVDGKVFSAGRAGFDFVATVLAGIALGWCIDWGFNTAPWGILGMTIVGFASGMRNLWYATDRKKMSK